MHAQAWTASPRCSLSSAAALWTCLSAGVPCVFFYAVNTMAQLSADIGNENASWLCQKMNTIFYSLRERRFGGTV